jgi:cysteine-rich repeat protein
MKFLQALAGLALLFPLATVGQPGNEAPRCFDKANVGIGVDGVCANSCGNTGQGQDSDVFNCPDVCDFLNIPYKGVFQCSDAGDQGGFNGNNICQQDISDGWFGQTGNVRKNCCQCKGCGDGIVQTTGNFNEQCEPPNTPGCSATCQIDSVCGNDIVEFGEQCDDGNNVDGDGCSSTCQFETGGGGVEGDPHFKTWRGHRFDFHGECDLVLIRSSEFGSGLGLDVHIRTKLRRDMSYISGATIRIGTAILEVESQGIYYLNGVAGAELPSEFSGFAFSHTQPTDKQHAFEVYLGDRERIKVKTYKDFVSVLIEQGQS